MTNDFAHELKWKAKAREQGQSIQRVSFHARLLSSKKSEKRP